jgi:hypothetical protein
MDPKPVYFARTTTEASLARNWLEQAGIASRVVGGESQSGALEIIESDPVVFVSAEDVERAQVALSEFHAQLESGTGLDEMHDAEGQFDWPLCPQCDELRQATCTACGKSGSEFSAETADGETRIWCLACGQHAVVEFADRCPWCQHDFAAAESGADGDSEPDTHAVVNSTRVILLVAGMVLILAAIAAAILVR